ncbi:MAG TPA: tRNA lysidine(34) synthetase TilS [Burkholderiales bacterium]|nr:tRNA lysidine(34) synthetase TilS [Burkholderiales bacterium]
MASSRKRPSVKRLARGARKIAVALSGGVDSVVLLHQLKDREVSAVHVHHGLSPNADAWASFCRSLCKRLDIPLTVKRVRVRRAGQGLEAAARDARYGAFKEIDAEVIALAHNLDDQAETVLMNLLRGAGARGASGMPERSRAGGKTLWRPFLDISRKEILAYARKYELEWIEDESNADESLTRNFIRRSIAPLLEQKFPRWQQSLGRAARHFSKKEAGGEELLRAFLRSNGLKAPSEAKLVEMLRQLQSRGARTLIEHDGARLRVYRDGIHFEQPADSFAPIPWRGERRVVIPGGGELRFKRVRGAGIACDAVKDAACFIRPRSGGERLQPHPRRPRRTLKNLFQEAGVPSWERERLPLLYCGDALVWAARLGIDEGWRAAPETFGWVPEWRPKPLFLRNSQGGRDKIAP